MSKILFISIKQKFVDRILSGTKTIELRKSCPKAKAGDTVIIYSTKPVMAITAVATIEDIIACPPSELWSKHSRETGITEEEYLAYYAASTKAIGIKLKNVAKLDEQILLSAIKLIHPHFTPPQTFKYLRKFEALRDYKQLLRK